VPEIFGYDPQLHLPQSEVVCIKYVDTIGVRSYIDRRNLRGTLPELINQTSLCINGADSSPNTRRASRTASPVTGAQPVISSPHILSATSVRLHCCLHNHPTNL
jgi:hypothetical protein